jgi:hypothetical protein
VLVRQPKIATKHVLPAGHRVVRPFSVRFRDEAHDDRRPLQRRVGRYSDALADAGAGR